MKTDFTDWRVLAVDDEPDNLNLIADVLEFNHATVCAAQNGEQGLSMVGEFRPTVILLDLAMPGVDGWEMHRRLRQRPDINHVPIIALTALAMPDDAERVMSAGFDGYITKPFRFADLFEQLEAIVGSYHAKHQDKDQS